MASLITALMISGTFSMASLCARVYVIVDSWLVGLSWLGANV